MEWEIFLHYYYSLRQIKDFHIAINTMAFCLVVLDETMENWKENMKTI